MHAMHYTIPRARGISHAAQTAYTIGDRLDKQATGQNGDV